MFSPEALSRDILATFLPNPKAIRAFENMRDLTNELSPTAIQDLTLNVGSAENKAVLALGLIASNYEELLTELAAIDAKNSGLIHNALQVAQDAYEYVSTLPSYQVLSDQIASVAGVISEITFANSPYAVVVDNETIIVDATGGNVVIDLPSIVLGMYYNVIKSDSSANTVTINSADGIIGSASQVLNAQYDSIELIAGSTEFYIR
jgi:hypothetical protein